MKKLTLEKEESLTGITIYKVFFGIECLFRREAIGNNAILCTDGRTVAETEAQAAYDLYKDKISAGYPKTTIMESIEI